jgi:hypothetical protein
VAGTCASTDAGRTASLIDDPGQEPAKDFLTPIYTHHNTEPNVLTFCSGISHQERREKYGVEEMQRTTPVDQG